MPILAFLTQLVVPITGLISKLTISDAEKQQLQNEFTRIQNEFAAKALEYEHDVMSARADIIKAEAQAAGWLQNSWRPVTMYTFLLLVVCDSFGWLHSPLAPQAWTLLQLGLGGYVVGRTFEKVVPHIADSIKAKGE